MNEQSRRILSAALLAWSRDELDRVGKPSLAILGGAVSMKLEDNPEPTREQMLALRELLEDTHLHPAIVGVRRSWSGAHRE